MERIALKVLRIPLIIVGIAVTLIAFLLLVAGFLTDCFRSAARKKKVRRAIVRTIAWAGFTFIVSQYVYGNPIYLSLIICLLIGVLASFVMSLGDIDEKVLWLIRISHEIKQGGRSDEK